MLGCVSSCLTVAHLGLLKNIKAYQRYTCVFILLRASASVWVPSSFFFLVAAQLSEHLSVSASGSLWNRALACLSLSDASSVFTVFLSKCHIRLPPGWQRSPRVQLVRLCLDRLSPTCFLGEMGGLHSHTSTHLCVLVFIPQETTEQHKLF